MEQSLFRSYTEEEIINLINENKVEEDLRDLLISSINCRKNKIAKHLIDLNVPYDYLDKLQYDAYLMAVARGSTEIIKKLQEKGLNLFKKYNIDNKELTALSFIKDLDTLHFFEQNGATKNKIEESSGDIVRGTIMYHNLELLKYLIDTYSIDITKIFYTTPSKSYTILEKSEEILNFMSDKLTRRREMTFFADELLYGEENYDRIIKKAYQRLSELENDIKEIKEYHEYVNSLYN